MNENDASASEANSVFYSIRQTQDRLNIGKTKLHELLKEKNDLQFAKIGRRTLILRSSVDEFIERSMVKQVPAKPVDEGVP